MNERTEEEKIVQAGIKVILGGQEHDIRPLVIRESREWRSKVAEFLSPLSQYINATSDEPEQFNEALKAIMVTMPEEVVELFFEYARDLNREEVEGIATDAEIAKAFNQVLEVAFPLSQSVVTALGTVTPKRKSR